MLGTVVAVRRPACSLFSALAANAIALVRASGKVNAFLPFLALVFLLWICEVERLGLQLATYLPRRNQSSPWSILA